ncbi:MAG: NADH-quinone oxidoreductase subunit N, partial [Bryobacterales bacterium]|nr:NADH-quinone oxidoreductase subunit N [Bryobacterales bacterium]
MNVTGQDFVALLPLLILAATAIAVMLAVAVRRSHAISATISFIGLAISFGSLWIAAPELPRQVT